ncbi:protein of unknown function [Methanoculleus bourgensis]|uniref:Uncharacterized protein n=1 Tax=Methanoculleus bourgensis TaxID=83986 RepID=A0A0X3BLE7_9EURY|nr:protein of unknown function [Methanoculleus bourgensis]
MYGSGESPYSGRSQRYETRQSHFMDTPREDRHTPDRAGRDMGGNGACCGRIGRRSRPG